MKKIIKLLAVFSLVILPGLVLPDRVSQTDISIPQKTYHNPVPDGREPGDSFIFMFYNTENLFDAIDDPLTDDEEFLPGGARGWNYNKYYRKLHSISKVILSAGSIYPPALIGLCETENSAVAEALIHLTPLSNYDYGMVYIESSDRRGIDLCLLYDRSRFEIINSCNIVPAYEADGNMFQGRPVLYVKARANNRHLHIFLNHWPSRRGGVLAGQPMRNNLSARIGTFADSLRGTDGDQIAVIVAGDFNCSPDDREMVNLSRSGMINLSCMPDGKDTGTYRYRGVWQHFDQVIVSESMIDGTSGYRVSECEIHNPAFLLVDDPVYPGKKPFATYDGFHYAGGYSDHLPVIMRVTY